MMSTTSEEFFERKYQGSDDPWNFASSEYEQARFNAVVRALSHRRYGQAFEPGCSVGVLTARLGACCDHVEAIDLSPTAVQHAQERCRELENVSIRCERLGEYQPQRMDLLVLCEVGYYFTLEELELTVANCLAQLDAGGTLLACHWLGSSADHLLSGDQVHELLTSLPGLRHEHAERHKGFRLDRWRKTEEVGHAL